MFPFSILDSLEVGGSGCPCGGQKGGMEIISLQTSKGAGVGCPERR